MRESAEKIGGRLKLRSSIAGGTELDLTVRGYIAFCEASRRAGVSTGRLAVLEKAKGRCASPATED
jgi:hypothetical protein